MHDGQGSTGPQSRSQVRPLPPPPPPPRFPHSYQQAVAAPPYLVQSNLHMYQQTPPRRPPGAGALGAGQPYLHQPPAVHGGTHLPHMYGMVQGPQPPPHTYLQQSRPRLPPPPPPPTSLGAHVPQVLNSQSQVYHGASVNHPAQQSAPSHSHMDSTITNTQSIAPPLQPLPPPPPPPSLSSLPLPPSRFSSSTPHQSGSEGNSSSSSATQAILASHGTTNFPIHDGNLEGVIVGDKDYSSTNLVEDNRAPNEGSLSLADSDMEMEDDITFEAPEWPSDTKRGSFDKHTNDRGSSKTTAAPIHNDMEAMKGSSPFRLPQSYVSDDCSENHDKPVQKHDIIDIVPTSQLEAKENVPVPLANGLTQNYSDSNHQNQALNSSVVSPKVATEKDISGGAMLKAISSSDHPKEHEEKRAKDVTKDKSRNFVRETSSDRESNGSRYYRRRNKRRNYHSRSRSRSRSRSYSRSRSRSRSYSRSRSPSCSRSPAYRRRSPPRGRARRSRSRSWSPRNRKSRSKSPAFNRVNDFRRENMRWSKQHCFDFIRGRCYRGESCRYMHHNYERSEGSRHHRVLRQRENMNKEIEACISSGKDVRRRIGSQLESRVLNTEHSKDRSHHEAIRSNQTQDADIFAIKPFGDADDSRRLKSEAPNVTFSSSKALVMQQSQSDLIDPGPEGAASSTHQTSNSFASNLTPNKKPADSPKEHPTSDKGVKRSHAMVPQFPASSQTQSSTMQNFPAYAMPNQNPISFNSSWSSLPPPPPSLAAPHDPSTKAGTFPWGDSLQFQQGHLPQRNDFGSPMLLGQYSNALPVHLQSGDLQHQPHPPAHNTQQSSQQFGGHSFYGESRLPQFPGSNTSNSLIHENYDSHSVPSTSNQSYPYTNTAVKMGHILPAHRGDQYDPLFDSLEPSSNSFAKTHPMQRGEIPNVLSKSSDMEEHERSEDVGRFGGVSSVNHEEFGETANAVDGFSELADAVVGDVDNGSESQPSGTVYPNRVEIGRDKIKLSEENQKSKDSRSMKLFQASLASFVKEVLKPSWRQGNMSKEAFKTVVKKTVDKVSGAMKGRRIPKSKEKIKQYIDSSERKLRKLVMGYVDKYAKG